MQRFDGGGIASDDEAAEQVGDDGCGGERGDEAVGFSPTDDAIVGDDFHHQRAVVARIDGAIAFADKVAGRVDGFAIAQRPEVGGVLTEIHQVNLNRCDAVMRRWQAHVKAACKSSSI